MCKTIEMYDCQVRILQTQNVNANQAMLDVNNHVSGVYFMKIATNNGMKTEKS